MRLDVSHTAPDKTELDTWFRTNQRLFLRTALAITRDPALADDAVQNASILILTRHEQFTGESTFVAWAKRVVTNAALTEMRRGKRYVPVSSFEGDLLINDSNPELDLAREQVRHTMTQVIGSLNSANRAAITETVLAERSLREAGDEMGISEKAVKSRLNRARGLMATDERIQALRD